MKCKVLIVLVILQICYSQQSSIRPESRIMNGVVVADDDIKYQVSIRLKSRDSKFGDGHICGGTLIGSNKVVTAAHCLYDADNIRYRKASEFRVVMGTMDRRNHVYGAIVSDVTSIAYTGSFNLQSRRDDVGLLFLETGASYNPYGTTEPIEITNTITAPGEIGLISGWGLTNKGVMSNVLLMANVTVMSNDVCKKTYGSYIIEGMICAAFEDGGTDTFEGDSGGPLVHNNKLIGIISWGKGTVQQGSPGVYTDVYHYRNWITNTKNSATQLVWSTLGVVVVILAKLLL